MTTALTCGLPPNQNILSCFLIKHKKYQSCASRYVLKSLLSPYWLVAFTPLSSKMVPGNFAPQEFRAAPKVDYECQFIRILKAKLMAAGSDFRDYSPELPLNQLWCLVAINRIHTGSDSYQHIDEKPQKVNSI